MKTNKKAVLGFAVAMVLSLAFMQGNSMKKSNQDLNIQQVAVGAGVMAGRNEGGREGGWNAISNMAIGYVATVGGGLSYTWIVSGTNPAGWVGWGTVGIAAL